MGLSTPLLDTIDDAVRQIVKDEAKWGPYHSAHEAKGVLDEEVFEFTLEVYKKQSERNLAHMRKELLQIAAVAIRAAAHICNEKVGRR